MEYYIEALKKSIEEMLKYESLSDEAEQRMIAEPTNKALEHEWDVYYTKEYEAWTQSIQYIKILVKCDDNTAKKMLATKRDRICELLR